MVLKKLIVRDILSIEVLDLDFESSGLFLLDGMNYDENRRNGSGKSSVWNILSWCLYGKTPRKVTSTELLRRGCQFGYAELTLSVSGKEYRIRRERPTKAVIVADGVATSQEQLERDLRLTYDQFVLTIYCPQNSKERFVQLGDSDKKDHLLRLMNLEGFEGLRRAADQRMSATEKQKQTLEQQVVKLQGQIETAQSFSLGAETMREQLQAEEDICTSLAEQLSAPAPQKPDTTQFDELESGLRAKLNELASSKTMIATHESDASAEERKHRPLKEQPTVPCPACSAALIVSGGNLAAATDNTAAQELHRKEGEAIKQRAQALRDKAAEIRKTLPNESELKKLGEAIRLAKQKLEQGYWDATQERRRLEGQLSNSRFRAEEIRKSIRNAEAYASKIEGWKIEQAEHQAVIQTLIGRLSVQAEVCKSVSPSGAPAYVMDSVVDAFNSRVGNYVSKIWTSASYEISTCKENKDGTFRAKLSDRLVVNGMPCSVGSLSGGEQTSLMLAADFALLDVLAEQFGIDSNVVVYDEPFNGLDAQGHELVIGLMKTLAQSRQVWVVDHASEAKSSFDKVVTMEKRNGASRLAC